METGIDFSFAAITGAQAKAAGYSFVARYLASSPGKAITAAQAADYRANGLGIVLVFEDYANQALDGQAQGVADAKEALAQANAIGFPSDRPIYFAIDFDEADTPLTNGEIYAYLDGAASVLGINRVGVYGGYYVVQRCIVNGHATWAWQTVAWSGGLVLAGAHIYQNGNSAFSGGADVDQALKTDFGQWGQGQEDEVSTTDINLERIMAFHIGGRDGEDGRPNAINGDSDTDLQSHVGQETNAELWSWYNSPEGDNFRNKVIPQVYADRDTAEANVTTLTAELQAANDKIAELEKQPVPTPTPDPTPNPTPTPTKVSIWQQIINFFTGK